MFICCFHVSNFLREAAPDARARPVKYPVCASMTTRRLIHVNCSWQCNIPLNVRQSDLNSAFQVLLLGSGTTLTTCLGAFNTTLIRH